MIVPARNRPANPFLATRTGAWEMCELMVLEMIAHG